MKKNTLLIIAFFATQFLFAQAPLGAAQGIPVSYESVENKPMFPGGINEFIRFIGKNFAAPAVEDLSGDLKVTFIIELNGTIGDVKIVKDIGYGTGDEIKRVLKICPKWTPGDDGGKPVRVIYTLPIAVRN